VRRKTQLIFWKYSFCDETRKVCEIDIDPYENNTFLLWPKSVKLAGFFSETQLGEDSFFYSILMLYLVSTG